MQGAMRKALARITIACQIISAAQMQLERHTASQHVSRGMESEASRLGIKVREASSVHLNFQCGGSDC